MLDDVVEVTSIDDRVRFHCDHVESAPALGNPPDFIAVQNVEVDYVFHIVEDREYVRELTKKYTMREANDVLQKDNAGRLRRHVLQDVPDNSTTVISSACILHINMQGHSEYMCNLQWNRISRQRITSPQAVGTERLTRESCNQNIDGRGVEVKLAHV